MQKATDMAKAIESKKELMTMIAVTQAGARCVLLLSASVPRQIG